MNRWQQRERKGKEARRFLNRCDIAQNQIKFGFNPPIVNGMGQCSGCRNPDDGELESKCRTCRYNEYFVEGVGA